MLDERELTAGDDAPEVAVRRLARLRRDVIDPGDDHDRAAIAVLFRRDRQRSEAAVLAFLGDRRRIRGPFRALLEGGRIVADEDDDVLDVAAVSAVKADVERHLGGLDARLAHRHHRDGADQQGDPDGREAALPGHW